MFLLSFFYFFFLFCYFLFLLLVIQRAHTFPFTFTFCFPLFFHFLSVELDFQSWRSRMIIFYLNTKSNSYVSWFPKLWIQKSDLWQIQVTNHKNIPKNRKDSYIRVISKMIERGLQLHQTFKPIRILLCTDFFFI